MMCQAVLLQYATMLDDVDDILLPFICLPVYAFPLCGSCDCAIMYFEDS